MRSWKEWKENFTMWVAWRLPRQLVYWCAVRLIAEAASSDDFMDDVPSLGAMEALELWEGRKLPVPILDTF